NFAFETTWAWTSRPMTISHGPVSPSSRYGLRSVIITSTNFPRVETRGSFQHATDTDHCLFVKRLADHLQAERQTFARKTGGHRHRRQTRQVDGHREDVVEIHGQRVVHLVADAERSGGSRRRQDGIDAPESGIEVPRDQRANT